MQNEQLQQVVKALQEANNILVTVKSSPSVDELSAAVGLTLALNKANKHATTVFSGNIPSTIEFLQPEQVIETNTDSLRDFIIALDKSKADKLRYKVEDSVVRIFITPYRTSISDKDLEFSQGDFNVDVVVALGVITQDDFDVAVTSHGRILHDATVISVTNQNAVSQVGSLNWQEPNASSVSEMINSVVEGLGAELLDGQMATAFLTGIVSETDRFKNEKTTPDVLAVSSRLMTAGANQQLISEKLEEPLRVQSSTRIANHSDDHDDGSLEIEHNPEEITGIHIDDNGNLNLQQEAPTPPQAPAPSPQEPAPSPPEDFSRQYIDTPVSVNNAATPPATVRSASEVEQPSLTASSIPESSAQVGVDAQNPESANGTSTPIDDMPESDKESLIPVMQHASRVVQPVSEEFQTKQFDNPIGAPVAAAEPGSIAALEQAVDSPHAQSPVGQSTDLQDHLGSVRRQTVTPEPVGPIAEEEVAPAHTPRPEPLNTVDQQQPSPGSAPAVPPPLMPPSQPQFFDADGKNNNPFSK
jgi:hypothetical protein